MRLVLKRQIKKPPISFSLNISEKIRKLRLSADLRPIQNAKHLKIIGSTFETSQTHWIENNKQRIPVKPSLITMVYSLPSRARCCSSSAWHLRDRSTGPRRPGLSRERPLLVGSLAASAAYRLAGLRRDLLHPSDRCCSKELWTILDRRTSP